MSEKLKIGDKVLVDEGAFDEQIHSMFDKNTVYEVEEIKTLLNGDQLVKIKGGVRLISHFGDEDVHDDWIHEAWCRKVEK